MRTGRKATRATRLFAAAAFSYVASCGLGAAVATRVIDSSGFRWLHNALYVTTCVTVAVAVGTGLWGSDRRIRRAALALAPAAAPLTAIPYLGTHTCRHPLVALAAAPFIFAGLACSLRSADRK